MHATSILSSLVLALPPAAQEPALQVDWQQNQVNGNWFGVDLNPRLWEDQEVLAQFLGGNLATVRNQSEQDWLVANLLTQYADQVGLQIGANDKVTEGTWVWSSSEPWGYSNWAASQPDNAWSGQDHAVLLYPTGLWDDYTPVPGRGIIELPTKPEIGWTWPESDGTATRFSFPCVGDLNLDGFEDLVFQAGTDGSGNIGVKVNNGLPFSDQSGLNWYTTGSTAVGDIRIADLTG